MGQDIAKLGVTVDPSGAVRGAAVATTALTGLGGSAGKATTSMAILAGSFKGLNAAALGLMGTMAPLLAAFTAFKIISDIVTTNKDFEFQMARVSGTMKSTTEQTKLLTKETRRLGATTKFTATESASGLEQLALAGFKTHQAIASLEPVLNLAIVGSISLKEASEGTAEVLNQFVLSADHAERVVDVLTNTSQNAATSVGELLQAFRFAGKDVAKFDIQVESTSAALGVLADAGQKATRGGTALRAIVNQLAKPTAEAAEHLQKMGIGLDEISPVTNSLVDIFRRLEEANLGANDALKIFTTRTVAGALALTQNVDKLEELTKANDNAAGSADKFSGILKNTLEDQIKSLGSAIEEAYLQLGDAGLLSAMKSVIAVMTDLVRGLTGSQTEFKIITTVLDMVISGFDTLKWGVTVVLGALKGEIVALGSTVQKNFGVILKILSKVGGQIPNLLNSPMQAVVNFWRNQINALIGTVKTLFDVFQKVKDEGVTGVALDAGRTLFPHPGPQSIHERLGIKKGGAAGKSNNAFNETAAIFKKNMTTDFVGDFISTSDFIPSLVKDLDFAFTRVQSKFNEGIANRQESRALQAIQNERDKQARMEAAARAGAVKTGGKTEDKVIKDTTAAKLSSFLQTSKMLSQLTQELELIHLTDEARERSIQLTKFQTEAQRELGLGFENSADIMEAFKDKLIELQKAQEIKAFATGVGDAFGQMSESIIKGNDSILDSFSNMLKSISDMVFKTLVTDQIAQYVTSFATSAILGGVTTTPTTDSSGVYQFGGNNVKTPARPTLFANSRQIAPRQKAQVINFNIQTPDANSFRKSIPQIKRELGR